MMKRPAVKCPTGSTFASGVSGVIHLSYQGDIHEVSSKDMDAGSIVRESRRRAGLTQRRLAMMAGVSQPTVARIESGATEPTMRLVERLVEACGLDLRLSLAERDDSDWSVASGNLRLDLDARVRQHQSALRFARAGRSAMIDARA